MLELWASVRHHLDAEAVHIQFPYMVLQTGPPAEYTIDSKILPSRGGLFEMPQNSVLHRDETICFSEEGFLFDKRDHSERLARLRYTIEPDYTAAGI
jgi:hypothetical protein